jgi:hypothetical protein
MSQQGIESFLRSVRRRWVLWRALEHAGVGLIAGCVVGMLLGAILYYRGDPTIGSVGISMAAGAVLGLAIGLMRSPSLFEAAVETDRQLELSDLLGTVLAIRRGRTIRADSMDDDWSRTLVAIATARVSGLSPSDVLLRKLGARAWGGIGLSAALCLTLALMSASPLVTRARSTAGTDGESRFDNLANAPKTFTSSQHAADEAPVKPDASATAPRDHDESLAEAAKTAGVKAKTPGADGSGEGESHTQDARAQTVVHNGSNDSPADSWHAGIASGGAGMAASDSQRSDAAGGIFSTGPTNTAPPWRFSTWSRDQAAAQEAIDRGQVPDAYRELVRDYFAR